MIQRKLFQVSKSELRRLLCSKEGQPVSETTFWRLCNRMDLAHKIGMTPDEFRRAKVFIAVITKVLNLFWAFLIWT